MPMPARDTGRYGLRRAGNGVRFPDRRGSLLRFGARGKPREEGPAGPVTQRFGVAALLSLRSRSATSSWSPWAAGGRRPVSLGTTPASGWRPGGYVRALLPVVPGAVY